jgi:hypothetical protein
LRTDVARIGHRDVLLVLRLLGLAVEADRPVGRNEGFPLHQLCAAAVDHGTRPTTQRVEVHPHGGKLRLGNTEVVGLGAVANGTWRFDRASRQLVGD